MRLVLVDCLDASGAHEEAGRVLAQARAWLLARAARISEPSWRTRFMNEVPTNAKLLRVVDAMGSLVTPSQSEASSTPGACPGGLEPF